MQYYWLNNNNNENLIIFFGGWSFDEKPFGFLDCTGYDVLMLYDYTSIPDKIPEIQSYKKYKKYFLIGWSMGVYAAYLLREQLPEFTYKIAVNGTPFPIDDKLGIPPRTFDLTLKYVYSGLKGKFEQNLFKRKADYERYLTTPVERTVENRAAELVSLDKFIKQQKTEYISYYDCALISDTDKIIPTVNQLHCWEPRIKTVKLDNGHFPFYQFSSWEEILEKCN